MYRVWGMRRNRTLRVLWMLEELGAAYEFIESAPRSPEVVARNPSGRVPLLADGDAIITDSVAICQHLADSHGRMTAAAGSVARARQDAMTQFAAEELDGTLWMFAKHKFVLPEELRVDGVRPGCEHDWSRAMASLEARLGDNTFATGDDITVPDIIIGHCFAWAMMAKFPVPKDGPVSAYMRRLLGREALARARG